MNSENLNEIGNRNNRLLDLILSNNKCEVSRGWSPLSKENRHLALKFEFLIIKDNVPHNF